MAMHAVSDEREVDRKLAGFCGMYCGACPIYRATVEQDAARLAAIAGSLGVAPEDLRCIGCRTTHVFCFGGECRIRTCAESKGVSFCTECDSFPCERIYNLIAGAPYRAEVLRNASRIREVGEDSWLQEQDSRWRCRGCSAPIAYYERTCHVCGRPASSA